MSINQLGRLIDLPDADLAQVLEYASSLSKLEAADHFKNLLGDTPQAIEFIAAFNSRRREPVVSSASSSQTTVGAAGAETRASSQAGADAVPKPAKHQKKKKRPLHAPPPRQLVDTSSAPGVAYSKKDRQDEYVSARPSTPSVAPVAAPAAPPSRAQAGPAPKLPPSAAGTLTSDLLAPPSTRQKSSNKPSTVAKVSITGGTAMHGASTALADLDAAIRSLEITTNPSVNDTDATNARRCNCVAARHPLQSAAPNCLSCGKVVCAKEGLGPCTFCGSALLSQEEVQAMIKELRAERGRERMAADRQAHRRPEVLSTPRPFTKPKSEQDASLAEAKAREHRDKLLNFQAQNARRTTVRDEAADFDTESSSLWASPEERARELKRQQKLLREMEWNARPDFEKRRQVVSIDVVGGKVVRRMAAVDRPPSPDDVDNPEGITEASSAGTSDQGLREASGNTTGSFSTNPLLGPMIKPVYSVSAADASLEGRASKKSQWRRVQDNLDNNESVILESRI
ncbi:uncharacterized protein E0L32_010317 [Thyridium curvatum]|uniref:TRIP4/RQT4 C2HC5-type zinc finger domain-containing protein n=1 Tax=Thyridium curvatum TaxID=1093900 RepID=A0A507AN01_9PEZI|nr:uncharacterized protein E0L32_010317 [Thyridium curvatum]TPX07986.1 hypothetical protein E0L32_010317 [Thyridium curvatum]